MSSSGNSSKLSRESHGKEREWQKTESRGAMKNLSNVSRDISRQACSRDGRKWGWQRKKEGNRKMGAQHWGWAVLLGKKNCTRMREKKEKRERHRNGEAGNSG